MKNNIKFKDLEKWLNNANIMFKDYHTSDIRDYGTSRDIVYKYKNIAMKILKNNGYNLWVNDYKGILQICYAGFKIDIKIKKKKDIEHSDYLFTYFRFDKCIIETEFETIDEWIKFCDLKLKERDNRYIDSANEFLELLELANISYRYFKELYNKYRHLDYEVEKILDKKEKMKSE